MAIVTVFQWNGVRPFCSQCGAEGRPRICACSVARVEDWHVWSTTTDITLGAWYPKARRVRLNAAERVFRS